MTVPAYFDCSPLQGGGTAGEPCGEPWTVGRLAALPVPNHATEAFRTPRHRVAPCHCQTAGSASGLISST